MQSTSTEDNDFWEKAYKIQLEMNEKFGQLEFDDSIFVYNPTIYASEMFCAYLQKYLTKPKKTLIVGINPGPWGMCQTGIPFTSSKTFDEKFKDLNASGTITIGQPEKMHLKKPVVGLKCTRVEKSGKRLWKLFDQFYEDTDAFFSEIFLLNYCALSFCKSDPKGIYVGLQEIKLVNRNFIQNACDEGLVKLITLIQPNTILCIGAYIRDRVKRIQKQNINMNTIDVMYIEHPSPMNRKSEKDWFKEAKAKLLQNGWVENTKKDDETSP